MPTRRAPYSSKHAEHIHELSTNEIGILCRLLTNAPSPHLPPDSQRRTTYNKFVKDAIIGLPERLISNPAWLTRKMIEHASDNERANAGEMCPVHLRLRPELIHSILYFIVRECDIKIEATLYQLLELGIGLSSDEDFRRLLPFAALGFASSMWTPQKRWTERFMGCVVDARFPRQHDFCPGCILARMGAETDVLVALRASILVWISKKHAPESRRVKWIEMWMAGFDNKKYDEMMRESATLARWIRQKVEEGDERDEKRRIHEYEPRYLMANLMRTVQGEKLEMKMAAERRFISRLPPGEAPVPNGPEYIEVRRTLSKHTPRTNVTAAAANSLPRPVPNGGSTPSQSRSTVFLDHDSGRGDFHIRRRGDSNITVPNGRSTPSQSRSTVFLDQDSGSSNFHVRHRGHSNIADVGEVPIIPTEMVGESSRASQMSNGTDYVPPRAGWSTIDKPSDFDMPAVEHISDYEQPAARNESAASRTTPALWSSPAVAPSSRTTTSTRRSPSMVSSWSSGSSNATVTPSEMLDPHGYDPKGKAKARARARKARSMAKSYQDLIGMTEMISSQEALGPPSAESFMGESSSTPRRSATTSERRNTVWPPAWI
ncbi:hypothetical protein NA57DRAFT_70461 [Rhizodiscina lignyota]|uniref:Uncharacterized protein n=1 Tax=Rhizodiscina lignyota TaxID=1504668 RepID=A0A9P4MBD3_9PEZI|nr:hypothetical protein NA57DRAFT_70461 [Rhizodiscina lignyota]